MARRNPRSQVRRLKRSPPTRVPVKRLLIVCEGSVTEPTYLKALRHDLRLRTVRIDFIAEGAVPKTLVERAVSEKRKAQRAAASSRDPNLKYDEVWCVFDVDEHPRLKEAMHQAKDNDVHVALSNPSFELWPLLHFQEQRATLTRGEAARKLRVHLPSYKKALPYERLAGRRRRALRRAEELSAARIASGDPLGCPSTGVYRLISVLEALQPRL